MKISSQEEALGCLDQNFITNIRKALSLVGSELGELNIIREFSVSTNDRQSTYTAWEWDAYGLPLIKYGLGHWLYDSGEVRICSMDEVNKELYSKAPDLSPLLSPSQEHVLRDFLGSRQNSSESHFKQ